MKDNVGEYTEKKFANYWNKARRDIARGDKHLSFMFAGIQQQVGLLTEVTTKDILLTFLAIKTSLPLLNMFILTETY